MRIAATRRSLLALLAAAGAATRTVPLGAASAQTAAPAWPGRPVRVIVPYPPGGSNDVLARPLAEQLGQAFGQPFVVENRGGAGGSIGADAVAKSAPDGHTLLFMSSALTTSAAVQRLPYDPVADFTPIAQAAVAPMAVVVGRDSPARSMADLLRIARERPGQIRFGITGPGDTNFFATELLKMAAGIDMEAVAYRGMGDAMLDAAAGRIELVVTTVASARSLIEAGQLRLLATAAEQRDPALPEVPTVRESTGVDYVTGVWWGLFGPARLPEPVRARLNEAVNRTLEQPAYRRLLATAGATPAPMTPADFAAKVRAEVERWTAVARRTGVAIR